MRSRGTNVRTQTTTTFDRSLENTYLLGCVLTCVLMTNRLRTHLDQPPKKDNRRKGDARHKNAVTTKWKSNRRCPAYATHVKTSAEVRSQTIQQAQVEQEKDSQLLMKFLPWPRNFRSQFLIPFGWPLTMATPVADCSVLLNDATAWEDLAPDHLGLARVVGDHGETHIDVKQHVLNLASWSPTAVAFMSHTDANAIHVGHIPTQCMLDPLEVMAFDDSVVAFVSGRDVSITAIILPVDAFARTAKMNAANCALMSGAEGWANVPPVSHAGPHGGGAARTDANRARTFVVLPHDLVRAVVAARHRAISSCQLCGGLLSRTGCGW